MRLTSPDYPGVRWEFNVYDMAYTSLEVEVVVWIQKKEWEEKIGKNELFDRGSDIKEWESYGRIFKVGNWYLGDVRIRVIGFECLYNPEDEDFCFVLYVDQTEEVRNLFF